MSLTLAVEMAVSIVIAKPKLAEKIGKFGPVIIVIVPGVRGLSSGTTFEGC